MGIIRANRAQPSSASNQIQQQRVRAREAEYYQRQYEQQEAEAAYAPAPRQAGHAASHTTNYTAGYATERGGERGSDQRYERGYDARQERGQSQRGYADQPVRHIEDVGEEDSQNWQETANETLDAALHLASHDTRIGRLEQAIGQLNHSVHALHAMQAGERMRHTRLFAIGGAVITVAIIGSMFFPRYANDQQMAAKIRQAVQMAAATPAALAPATMAAAPMASAGQIPQAASQAAPQAAPMIAPPGPAPGMAPAYATQPAYPQPQQRAPSSQQRIPTSSAPTSSASDTPDYLPNTVALGASAIDDSDIGAPAAIPAPPAPPIRVAQVFTPFQNKVRARVSRNGDAIPASWQPMFDREAKGDLKGKLQVAAKFLKGEDVTHDQVFAVQLIKEAAEAGEKEAIMWLATAYQAGNLGKVDLAEAAHWYELAGKAGITKAFTELGRIYEAGIDGAPDPEVALAWYQRAASAGDIPAAEAVARLARITTSASPTPTVAAAIPATNRAAQQYVANNGGGNGTNSALLFSAEPRTDLNMAQQRPIPASVAMMQPNPRAMGAENPPAAADLSMASAASITPPPLTEGSTINVAMDTGETTGDVRAIQRMLKALGYRVERIDGLMGPQTANAIRAYQRNKMLYPDGEPGPQLMENLMNDMRWGN